MRGVNSQREVSASVADEVRKDDESGRMQGGNMHKQI